MASDAPASTVGEFVLPDLGEGLEDAVLLEWHVCVGDTIALNQPLCTVETAKATVELPSPLAGTVVELLGELATRIRVGSPLVRIAIDAGVVATEPQPSDAVARPPRAPAQDVRRTPTLVGYGPAEEGAGSRRRGGRPARAPFEAPVREAPAGRPLAKPPVRQLARRLGLDLSSLHPGSGPGGVITRDDVERAVSRSADATRRRARQDVVIRVEGVRARIAERMTQSRSSIPDATCRVTVDCGRLLQLRTLLRPAAADRAGGDVLTPFVLMLRALVAALEYRPIMNSVFDGAAGEIRQRGEIHLGIGTDTPRGLLVPVVRNAEQLALVDLAMEVHRVAEGARAGLLAPDELVGSTFTVSNFGVFGLDEGDPVINYPEVAILGIGAIRDRAVVIDDAVVVRPTVSLTCVFDHRACDGADAAAFLGRLRQLIEAPEQLLLDA